MTITNNLKRPEPQALASTIEALAARFGNRLITSQAVRDQQRAYHDLAGAAAAGRGCDGRRKPRISRTWCGFAPTIAFP